LVKDRGHRHDAGRIVRGQACGVVNEDRSSFTHRELGETAVAHAEAIMRILEREAELAADAVRQIRRRRGEIRARAVVAPAEDG